MFAYSDIFIKGYSSYNYTGDHSGKFINNTWVMGSEQ